MSGLHLQPRPPQVNLGHGDGCAGVNRGAEALYVLGSALTDERDFLYEGQGSGELTKEDDKRKGNFKIEVPAIKFTLTGYPAGAMAQAGSTAVHSLSSAMVASTATGHPDITTAARGLTVALENTFNISGNNINIYQQQTFNITQKSITEIHEHTKDVITTLESNNIPFFDCKDAFESCRSNATDPGQELHCWVIYSACLGQRVISAINPLKE